MEFRSPGQSALGGRVGDALSPTHLKYTLFILLLLLLPGKSLQLYYVLVTMVLISFTLGVPRVANRYVAVFAAVITFVLLGALLRSIGMPGVNPRDYIEAARFAPLLLIYASMYRWRQLRLESIFDAAFLYLLLDAGISVLQFLQVEVPGITGLVRYVYTAEHHYERSLLLAQRAPGLSTGPGQHSAVLFVLATLMLYGMFRLPGRTVVGGAGLAAALLAILLSQSQTGFVVTMATLLGMLCYFLWSGDLRNRILSGLVLGCMAFAGASLFVVLASELRYLHTLFTYGLGRSAYVLREERWRELITATFDTPGWLPLGWGKDYFGAASGAMDSDFVYIYCVYGILVLGVFVLFGLCFVGTTAWNMARSRREAGHRVLLFFLVLGGVVFAWPNAFFTTPNILVLLALIHAASWWRENMGWVPVAPVGAGGDLAVSRSVPELPVR